MRNSHFTESRPEDIVKLNEAKRRIVDYWSSSDDENDSGGTTWDVLDDIRMRVTELLDRGRRDDIRQAERLTAHAEFLRQGGTS